MKWLRTAALAIAAFLVVVGFSMLGRSGRKLKKVKSQRDGLILDGSRKARDKAHKAGERANELQIHADEAKAKGIAAINGVNDEDMRAVLDSWRSDGV